jgi:hypothetical protein
MPPLEQELPTDLLVYDWDEIRKHDKEDDAWVVKDGQVKIQALLLHGAHSKCDSQST